MVTISGKLGKSYLTSVKDIFDADNLVKLQVCRNKKMSRFFLLFFGFTYERDVESFSNFSLTSFANRIVVRNTNKGW